MDNWHKLQLSLAAGEHGYLIIEDGQAHADARNPLTTFRGDDEVSLLMIDDCSVPQVR